MGSRQIVAWLKRLKIRVAVMAALVLAGLAMVGASARAEGCVNEAVRVEQGAAALGLPECRGYELVTAVNEHPNLVNNALPVAGGGPGRVEVEASAGGGGVVFQSWYAPSGSPSAGHMFRSTRGGGGWVTVTAQPALGPEKYDCLGDHMYFTRDLTGDVLMNFPDIGCSMYEPPLAAGESRTSENLLVHMSEGAPYELVNHAPEEIVPSSYGFVTFQAASADMSHVVFSEGMPLTAEAPAGEGLYEWDEGALRLVTFLPDGQPVQGSMAAGSITEDGGFGKSLGTVVHAVSGDGEGVVFDAGDALYLRENAGREPSAIVPGSTQVNGEQCSEPEKACTVQLDASQGPGASGGGAFQRASVDGSRIFFTDESRLTTESTAAAGKPDLYEYAVGPGRLSDLTVDASEAADVLGVVAGSEDGSYLYFVARGVLGATLNDRGLAAVAGKPNLYLLRDGVVSFIATLNHYDARDWEDTSSESIPAGQTTPDGQWLAFNSIASLTGYENAPAEKQDCDGTTVHFAQGEPCDEIYVYDAAASRLSCVSCAASGANPTGQAELREPSGTFARRALSLDGSVFFDTPSPLLGQDTNGTYDVYEWSPPGVGACTPESTAFSAEAGGCQYSISSGTSPEPSYFVDASESGEDAYFVTSQGLVQADTDNALSLYDARVGGGFPAGSGEAAQEAACASAEACKPPPSEAPAQLPAASSVLSVGGNLVAPPVPTTPPLPPVEGHVAHKQGLTRAQQLARALRACHNKPRRRRRVCEATARSRFGAKTKKHRSGKSGKGGGR